MSIWIYTVQAVAIGATLLAIVKGRLLQAQILVWTVGVVAVAWRYDLSDQLSFYSNDQVYYTAIVRILWSGNWPGDLSWWLDSGKTPYTLAALPLTLMGVHETLALKTVSLVCFLGLTHLVIRRANINQPITQIRNLYLTGCGMIGSFFSILALRETMMMLFAYLFATSKSASIRLASIIGVGILRSHLAIALLLAEIIISAWQWFARRRNTGFGFAPLFTVIGVIIGNSLYTVRMRDLKGLEVPFFNNWGIREVIQIASNYVGLQFLTSESWNINFSITDLLMLRVVLSETVVIPALFIILMLVAAPRMSRVDHMTLLAFSIYISIATNTDFNSFRQNIPFMPLMGLAIIKFLESRRNARLPERPSSTVAVVTGTRALHGT
jgi:hypothetical protein